MDSKIRKKFDSYPGDANSRMPELRQPILDVACELDDVGSLDESLKWGEPSYTSSIGSPLRIDWKSKEPGQCSMYFHCQTKLADTFRELYGNRLECKGNREIVLKLDHPLPTDILGHCISLALRYHKVKQLPLLGE